MCVTSYVGDYFKTTAPNQFPQTFLYGGIGTPSYVHRSEFNALKKEMEELKLLLIAAKRYDEQTGQPHCEHEEKVALIKRISELVGVEMKDVL
jgi:hypothetical protein